LCIGKPDASIGLVRFRRGPPEVSLQWHGGRSTMINFPSTDRDVEEALRFLSKNMPDAERLEKPTLLHSVRVGVYLYNHGYERSIVLAGLLHDLIEDSTVTAKEIANDFGNDVADLVKANTKNENLPKENRYEELLQRCVQDGEQASIVKAADIIDNLITYRKINSEEGINNMLQFGTILLKLKPKDYTDKIFEELDSVMNKTTI